MKGKVKLSSAGVLATKLPRLRGNSSLQVIDRQWTSLVQDDVVKNGGWEKHGIIEFWKAMLPLPEYQELAQFYARGQSFTTKHCCSRANFLKD